MHASASGPAQPLDDPGLQLHFRNDHRERLLGLAGPLDRRTVHLIHDAVATLLSSDGARWTFDVTGLPIGDQAGARAFDGAHRRLLRRGRALTSVCPSPASASALTRLRLNAHSSDNHTPPSAAAALPA